MQLCDDFRIEQLEVCRYESTTLSAPATSSWFSLQEGLIHTGPNYTLTTDHADTIFSVAPQPGACPVVTIYTISIVNTKTVTEKSTVYVCEGAQLSFQVESGWEQVLWSSIKKGVLSNENSLVFQVTEADTVKVELSDGGCSIERATAINISNPELVLDETAYQVMKGESIQLSAGGGETYVWSPASGLDNPAIANPVATPVQTTEYQVTVVDSIGCTVEGKVLVIVEETAFIPNLFTPNDDGKNDELKAYGLGTVTNFSFSIYNREGNLMYSTQNTSELTGTGWNGSVRGVKQPSGVYYWKIKGENNVGRNTLLNGKDTGSIILIR
jgi:gliding motility-associated-like protein